MPAYRARYTLWIDYTDSQGLGTNSVNQSGQAFGSSLGPTLQMNQSICPGSGTFLAADISSIMTQITVDLTAQMTANQTRIQNFASGGG
jgi:hypothetical protein